MQSVFYIQSSLLYVEDDRCVFQLSSNKAMRNAD